MWARPSGKQMQSINDANERINLWDGAVRSSKTVGANLRWIKFIANAVKHNQPGELLMVGKTERTLRRNILQPMQDFLGQRLKVNAGNGEATIWGRRIHLVGANDERAEGKIRGGTYLAAYVDEATLIPESFWQMLMSRLSMKGSKVFATTNPDGPYHWLKTNYIDRMEELSMKRFQFRLEDNKYLDPEYIENLKREYTGLWYKRYILGLWVLAAGAVYDMWDEDKHVKSLAALESIHGAIKPYRHIVDVDYGTSNATTFSHKIFFKADGQTHVHTLKEYYHDGREAGQKTDAQYLDDLAKFMEGIPGKPKVIVDPSAASFKVAGAQRGFYMQEAKNDVIDGIRTVSTFLGSGRYTVDPSCKETLKSYASYVWDERAQKRGEDKPLKQFDHAVDRDRYGIFTELGSTQWLAL